jgi:hypothetical protein
MKIASNQDIGTPDGNGIVLGRTPEDKVIVRLRVQKEVTKAQRSRTFNGWQMEYTVEVLTEPVKMPK